MSSFTLMEIDFAQVIKERAINAVERNLLHQASPDNEDLSGQFGLKKNIIPALKLTGLPSNSVLEMGASFVILFENKNKVYLPGNTYTIELFKRVCAMVMPASIPTPFTMYAQEMKESVKEGWVVKIWLTALLSALITWLGWATINLIGGLLLLGVIDVVLSLIPGNIKPGTEADHKIQSKAWNFITNIVAIVAVIKAHYSLVDFTASQDIFALLGNYFHYVVISWIYTIYIYRIVKYVARGNNVSIPQPVANLFKKENK